VSPVEYAGGKLLFPTGYYAVYAILLPDYIKRSQNLTKLLQQLKRTKGYTIYWDTVYFSHKNKFQCDHLIFVTFVLEKAYNVSTSLLVETPLRGAF